MELCPIVFGKLILADGRKLKHSFRFRPLGEDSTVLMTKEGARAPGLVWHLGQVLGLWHAGRKRPLFTVGMRAADEAAIAAIPFVRHAQRQ